MKTLAILLAALLGWLLSGCSDDAVAGSSTVTTNVKPVPGVGGAGGSSAATSSVVARGGSSGSTSSIARVLSQGSVGAATNPSIMTVIQFVNLTTTDFDLPDFRLRYWLTAELTPSNPTSALVPDVTVGPFSQRVTVCVVNPARPGADHYIEIAFDPTARDTLLAGASLDLSFETHKSDFTDFDQTNDYSYPASLPNGAELVTVGVYRKDVLVAGVEP